jgi:hypothetical protein
MGEWSANNQARATAVWDKLLGIFGDGIVRKFGEEPPAEWVEAIGDLNDFQIRRGIKRLIYSWKAGIPNLPDFVRFCRVIGDDAPDEGPSAHIPVPKIEGPKFDGWDISGNMRFWKYISHRLTESHRPWGAPWSQEHAECTRIAVRYKNAWAQDMREATTMDTATGEIVQPPEFEQARQFSECMRRAESDIVVYRRGQAA